MYRYSLLIAICWFPFTISFASTCSDSESLKNHFENKDPQGALQEMDNCLATSKELSTKDDLQLFNDLIKQVLNTKNPLSFQEVYGNFQHVLNIHLLSPLSFKFEQYFKKHPTEDNQLFPKVREWGEKYYFYYDTGRFLSYSRGIALTDKSLLWKNFSSQAQHLAFADIQSVKLIYQRGFSLTGWQLRFNKDKNNEIRLSGIPDKAIIPFVSALIYFINFHTLEQIALEVPEREVAILAGWVTLCHDKQIYHDNPLKALQLLDACFSVYGTEFQLSQADDLLLNKLLTLIFEKQNINFAEGYNTFKILLSTHFFKDIKFKFGHLEQEANDNLPPWWCTSKKAHFVKYASTDFKCVLPKSNDYFYFDMGRVISGARGLLLTNKAIVWKNVLGDSISWENLTGLGKQLFFEDISSISLIHEMDLSSLAHWKLRLNEEYDIVLSQLSAHNVKLFASAVVYFINMASGAHLSLQVPDID